MVLVLPLVFTIVSFTMLSRYPVSYNQPGQGYAEYEVIVTSVVLVVLVVVLVVAVLLTVIFLVAG